jgi:hypothetical protein
MTTSGQAAGIAVIVLLAVLLLIFLAHKFWSAKASLMGMGVGSTMSASTPLGGVKLESKPPLSAGQMMESDYYGDDDDVDMNAGGGFYKDPSAAMMMDRPPYADPMFYAQQQPPAFAGGAAWTDHDPTMFPQMQHMHQYDSAP